MPSSAEMIRRAVTPCHVLVTPCHVLVTDFSFELLTSFCFTDFLEAETNGESKDASAPDVISCRSFIII